MNLYSKPGNSNAGLCRFFEMVDYFVMALFALFTLAKL